MSQNDQFLDAFSHTCPKGARQHVSRIRTLSTGGNGTSVLHGLDLSEAEFAASAASLRWTTERYTRVEPDSANRQARDASDASVTSARISDHSVLSQSVDKLANLEPKTSKRRCVTFIYPIIFNSRAPFVSLNQSPFCCLLNVVVLHLFDTISVSNALSRVFSLPTQKM